MGHLRKPKKNIPMLVRCAVKIWFIDRPVLLGFGKTRNRKIGVWPKEAATRSTVPVDPLNIYKKNDTTSL